MANHDGLWVGILSNPSRRFGGRRGSGHTGTITSLPWVAECPAHSRQGDDIPGCLEPSRRIECLELADQHEGLNRINCGRNTKPRKLKKSSHAGRSLIKRNFQKS
ncbi:hypothetical protein ACO22_04526 [Paracoccidioides brasiliensis]|uniref:Uncharacterized protein n=1 Tax=Paracoccidioides brasiliensis TaxID=121759 RepID=A0A1D2JCZ8_PARBR|nr:hypothetical protein ACO22_04526 [Paracoccidioides brasiliensis]